MTLERLASLSLTVHVSMVEHLLRPLKNIMSQKFVTFWHVQKCVPGLSFFSPCAKRVCLPIYAGKIGTGDEASQGLPTDMSVSLEQCSQ